MFIEVSIASPAAGDFTVAHTLGVVPEWANIQMTSGGEIWFQPARYDANNLYLTATDASVTAIVQLSGTVTPPAPLTSSLYPSIEDVFNAARIFLDDAMKGSTGTWGEGRIFTDDITPLNLNILNLALRDLKRQLENHGITTYREEAILTPITPINSSMGLAVPNPAVFQNMNYTNFNDGLTTTTAVKLPPDLISPLRLWWRTNSTNNVFEEIFPAPSGLPSLLQGLGLGWWEWRGDAIWWNGSTQTSDVRVRYEGAVQLVSTSTLPAVFPITLVGIADSTDALGYFCAYHVAASKLPPGAANELKQNYKEAMALISNRYTRQNQRTQYARPSYGDEEEYPFSV